MVSAIGAATVVALAQVPADSTARADLPSPSTGWLIVSGPPGAGASCAVTRAYDVETGAGFVHDSCAGRSVAGTLPAAAVRQVVSALLSRVEPAWSPGGTPVSHTWRWVVTGDRSLIGDVPWVDAGGAAARDSTTRLLRATEETLVDHACAARLPPPSLVLVATLPRMVNPVSADASQDLNVRYRSARERWAQFSAC